jgi:hypothetical protein
MCRWQIEVTITAKSTVTLSGMKKRQTVKSDMFKSGTITYKAIQAQFVAPVLYFIKTRNITVIN